MTKTYGTPYVFLRVMYYKSDFQLIQSEESRWKEAKAETKAQDFKETHEATKDQQLIQEEGNVDIKRT